MSLESYTSRGNILPIGLLVCSHCKERNLKGVDFANSQVITSSMCDNATGMLPGVKLSSISSNPTYSSNLKIKPDSEVLLNNLNKAPWKFVDKNQPLSKSTLRSFCTCTFQIC